MSKKKKIGYVDGFVIPIEKKNLTAYKRIAKLAGKVWMEHGAIQYVECVGDDLNTKWGLPFPKLTKARPGETVLFSYIVYESKKHRDKVNAKAMKDPRLSAMMDPSKMLFDMKRLTYGGFKVIVAM